MVPTKIGNFYLQLNKGTNMPTDAEKIDGYIEILKKKFPELQYINGTREPDKIKVAILGKYFSIGIFNMTQIETHSFYEFVEKNIYKKCLEKDEPLPNIYAFQNEAKHEVKSPNNGYPHLGEAYTGILHRHPASEKWPEMKNHVVVDLEDWNYARKLLKATESLKNLLDQ